MTSSSLLPVSIYTPESPCKLIASAVAAAKIAIANIFLIVKFKIIIGCDQTLINHVLHVELFSVLN